VGGWGREKDQEMERVGEIVQGKNAYWVTIGAFHSAHVLNVPLGGLHQVTRLLIKLVSRKHKRGKKEQEQKGVTRDG